MKQGSVFVYQLNLSIGPTVEGGYIFIDIPLEKQIFPFPTHINYKHLLG